MMTATNDLKATNNSNVDDSQWPRCAMLMWGVFSTKTPQGRQYVRASYAAAAMVIVPTFLFFIHQHWHMHYMSKRLFTTVIAVAMPSAISLIVWEFRKYLLSLDELARRLQLEAMACTYLTGFIMASVLCGIWLEALPNVDAIWFCPLWFALLEPVRAGWLYALSRRY